MDYKEVKEALQEQGSTAYFTREFYESYLKAIKTGYYNRINNIDDAYQDGNITKHHSYDEVYNSDFYNLNGSMYCIFLEIMNQRKTLLKDIIALVKQPLWVNEPKYDLSSFFPKASGVTSNLLNKTVDYITYDGNNALTIEVI